MTWAEWHFDMHRPVGDDRSRKIDHLQTLKRSGFRVPELEAEPPLPDGMRYLWQWFCDLVNYTGATRLTWTELESWKRTTCRPLLAYEAEAIMRLETLRHG